TRSSASRPAGEATSRRGPCSRSAEGEVAGRPPPRRPGWLPGFLAALLAAVVLEVDLGRLARLDRDVGRLAAVLLVPGLDRVLAGGHVADGEAARLAAAGLQRVLGDAGVPAHPRVHVALPLDDALLGGRV